MTQHVVEEVARRPHRQGRAAPETNATQEVLDMRREAQCDVLLARAMVWPLERKARMHHLHERWSTMHGLGVRRAHQRRRGMGQEANFKAVMRGVLSDDQREAHMLTLQLPAASERRIPRIP